MAITWGALTDYPWPWLRLPVFLLQQPPRLKDALVWGFPTGQSPDIVSVLAEGKRQGCLTLAITNETDSPLAQVADFYLDVEAGSEKAVAATKTYTAQLTSIAMLSAALLNDEKRWQELDRLPDGLKRLKAGQRNGQISAAYRNMQWFLSWGRL